MKRTRLRGVIFDLDGTLFEADYDWPAIKRQLGLQDPRMAIMDYFKTLPPQERRVRERLLEEIEDQATAAGKLKPGARELIQFLKGRGLKLALVTNNRRAVVERILVRYDLDFDFDLVLTREIGVYKPSGEPLLLAARGLGLEEREVIAVGDGEFDLRAARDAGIPVIIVNPNTEAFRGRADRVVRDLFALRGLLNRLLERRATAEAQR